MRTHLNVLAVLYLIGSIGELLIALILFGVGAAGFGSLGMMDDAAMGMGIAAGASTAIGVFFLILALPGLVLAYGLYQRRAWARWLGFVLGALNLFNFPFGTLLGGYTIWVLLQDETRAILESRAPA